MGAALDLLTLPQASAPFKVAPLNLGVVEPAQFSLGMSNSHLLAHAMTNSLNFKLYDYSWKVLSISCRDPDWHRHLC